MATTTDSDGTHETLPYSEHDKLGPLGSKAALIHDPVELRAALLGEFATAVTAAKDAAAAVDRDAASAVHDARKALRRCRAVLAMIAGALHKGERRAVKAALRDARRSLSMVRDHTVAPETLGELELGDDDRDTAKRVLDSAAAALPPHAEIKQLLAEAATRAAAQAEALEAALPPAVDETTVIAGITQTYAEARHARRAAKRSKQWFHTWRRRSKELTYELDFLAKHAGARTLAIHHELDAVSHALGPAVDLVMLRDFVQTHGQGIPADAIDHLRETIDATLADQMKVARKEAKDAFAQKARKFSKRIAKSVKRDLTPADDNHREPDDTDRPMD